MYSMDLGDFGVSTEQDPPRIQKRNPVYTTLTDETRQTGYIGVMPDRHSLGYIRQVERGTHRFRALAKDEGGAYAISNDALRTLQRENVGAVLIAEADTGDVYEYRLQDFDKAVPDKFLQTKHDPQTYCPVDTATKWPDHYDDVLIPRGEEIV